MKRTPAFVLIHSPLASSFTWGLVSERLRERGITSVVPSLISAPSSKVPYWKQHAAAVAGALSSASSKQPILLVGHSGAGPLLPAIRKELTQPFLGYLFVDAGWPMDGKSRLDLFGDRNAAEQFRQSARDGFLPVWSNEDLKAVIPNDAVRGEFVRELRPLPLGVYEEMLPVFKGWPDAPCGYLRFGDNPAYDSSVLKARQAGYPVLRLEGDHFHMLVDPEAVTDAILSLVELMHIG